MFAFLVIGSTGFAQQTTSPASQDFEPIDIKVTPSEQQPIDITTEELQEKESKIRVGFSFGTGAGGC